MRGRSTSTQGSLGSSRSRTRKRPKPRTAERWRTAERAPSPAFPSETR